MFKNGGTQHFSQLQMLNKLPQELLETICMHLEKIEYQKLRLACSTHCLNLIQLQSFQIFKNQKNPKLTKVSFDYFNDDVFSYLVSQGLETEFIRSLGLISKVSISLQKQVFVMLKKAWVCRQIPKVMLVRFVEVCTVADTYPDSFLFNFAAKLGLFEVVCRLLKRDQVDPRANGNYPIREASKNGHFAVVEQLLKHPKVDPTAHDNFAIRESSRGGHTKVVELLLANPNVDPTARDNEAIRLASRLGFPEVVVLLLKHPNVDPSALDNFAIRESSRHGHFRVVEMLLKHSKVDPTTRNHQAIREASRCGKVEVVSLLLKHPKVDPQDAILPSSEFGHTFENFERFFLTDTTDFSGGDYEPQILNCNLEKYFQVLAFLLEETNVDPSAYNNAAFLLAAAKGCLSMVKRLLADSRVDPSDQGNLAIRAASSNGHTEVVKLLLQDSRVHKATLQSIMPRALVGNMSG